MEFLRLTKPRSVLLLAATALASMALAGPGLPPLPVVALTLVGGGMAAGGANALNCYLDRDIDARMKYTAHRPLPAGTLSPRQALAFGLALCASAIVALGVGVNWLTAALAATGALYYVLIYTWWLKRTSVWNIVIGGVAGAFPVLAGWAAATGGLSPWAFWLGGIVVLWTPPHTWALALVRYRDYLLVGIPMLPVARGGDEARRQILVYSVLLVALTLAPAGGGPLGWPFLAAAVPLGGLMLLRSVELLREAGNRAAWRLYKFSIVYLALLFGAVMVVRVGGWLLSGIGHT